MIEVLAFVIGILAGNALTWIKADQKSKAWAMSLLGRDIQHQQRIIDWQMIEIQHLKSKLEK